MSCIIRLFFFFWLVKIGVRIKSCAGFGIHCVMCISQLPGTVWNTRYHELKRAMVHLGHGFRSFSPRSLDTAGLGPVRRHITLAFHGEAKLLTPWWSGREERKGDGLKIPFKGLVPDPNNLTSSHYFPKACHYPTVIHTYPRPSMPYVWFPLSARKNLLSSFIDFSIRKMLSQACSTTRTEPGLKNGSSYPETGAGRTPRHLPHCWKMSLQNCLPSLIGVWRWTQPTQLAFRHVCCTLCFCFI